MRSIPGQYAARAVLCAVLLVSCVLTSPVPVSAAGDSRRIAIAPFASSAKEDIGATVSALPRLLASRLMALAGADVVLLPPGGNAPEAAAREAKVPLLLQGTVSKLGKGYSIDTTVTDLETGKSAGAFFAAAATEDDIIAQLGILSGEISEKVFGVQGAIRATAPPAPVPAPPAPAAFPGPSGGPAIGGTGAPAYASAPAAPAPPSTPAEGWVPSKLGKIGQSDKIADEIYGVVAGDVDADGNGEVVTWGRSAIYVYKVKGNELLPHTRVTRSIQHHILNVDAIDLDGDGKKDLIVTDLRGDRLVSFVMLRRGDGFVETPETFSYHLAVLRGWDGKDVVVGQREGAEDPFRGKIYTMKWDGKRFAEGESLPINASILPVSDGGVYSLSPGRVGADGRWLYVDTGEHLRVLDLKGKTVYQSKNKYGSAADGFEYGKLSRLEGRRPIFPLRRPPRAIRGSDGDSMILVTETQKGMIQGVLGSIESSRVVLLEWSGGGVSERAASPKSDFFHSGADLLTPGDFRRGGKVIVSVVEQTGSVYKDRASRLVLLRVE